MSELVPAREDNNPELIFLWGILSKGFLPTVKDFQVKDAAAGNFVTCVYFYFSGVSMGGGGGGGGWGWVPLPCQKVKHGPFQSQIFSLRPLLLHRLVTPGPLLLHSFRGPPPPPPPPPPPLIYFGPTSLPPLPPPPLINRPLLTIES